MTSYTSIVDHLSDPAFTDGTPSGGTPYSRFLLVLNEDGEASIDERTYYGGDGTPFDEWHGRTLTWTFAAEILDLETLREDLGEGGRLAVLLDRVKAGHSVKWDGNNHVGRLSEDAEEANEEISRLLGEWHAECAYADTTRAVWNAADWLQSPYDIADNDLGPDSTAEEIEALARAMVEAAADDGAILRQGDVEDVLARLVQEAREERDSEADEA